MKNIFVCEDISQLLPFYNENNSVTTNMIAAVESFPSSGHLLILTLDGKLLFLIYDDFSFKEEIVNLNVEDVNDSDWFYISAILETNSIICVSHSGSVVCISNQLSGSRLVDVEGQVDGGIASAQMSCDKSTLVLVTNNNSMIFMTAEFEVVREVTIEPKLNQLPSSISWRADSEYFSLLTTDAVDGVARMRSYSKIGDFHSVGKNVADGPTTILSGIGSCTAYSPNGSLVAVPLQKSPDRLQIAFFEPNGLRHGEFDIVMPVASGDRWQVDSLHWDASTTILAVGLSILSPTNTANTSNLHATTYVQLYTRGNYHWYLKQQFSGCDLRCLGFDSEVLRRLYCTQLVPLQRDDIVEMNNEESSIPDDAAFSNVIRMVDLGWDVCSSLTEDASVAVLDGRSVLLTPMGIIVTPPPMSTYKVTLPSVCNYATFAKPCSCVKCHSAATTDVDASVEWMLACLCDDATLHIVSGDKKGSSSEPIAIKFLPELCRLLGCNATEIGSQYFSFKSVVLSLPSLATCDTFNVAITYYDHGRFLNPEKASIENQCNVLTLQIYRQYFSIANAKLLVGFEGSIARLVNCPVNCQRFLAGVVSNSGFEIQTVGFSFKHKHMSDHNRGDEDEETCVSVLSTYVDSILLPEVCYLLTAVVDSSSSHQLRNSDSTDMEVSNTEYDPMSDSSAFAVIGLSPRNRLYCGEVLLVAGASSFALNDGLGILTYISVGTRPALHYISVPALIGLSALHGQHLEEQYFLECGEARPLERGSRLVASVSGQPKTVVQMPRGNLETFEPRPLILMKARKLLERKQIYDCLVLFRRQKVDLNYLVDHDPTVFFNNVSSFVRETMKSDPEYLSLFISSLEPGNASVIKYPIAIVGRLADQPVVKPRNDDDRIAEGVCWKDVRGQSKVDTVCRAIRVELLQLLQEHPGALQPLLCTYARQQPPLLEDALAYISRHYSPIQPSGTEIGTQAHNKDRATVLSSTKVQSAIKYLAFLAEGSKLFEAALGVCDFQMARAVARLCQMDPKQYVPLIEKFESISQLPTRQSTAHHSFYDAITRFEVNYHLNRKEKCVTAGIDVIVAQINIDINIAAASFSSDSNKVDSQIKLKDDIRTLQSIIDIVFKMVCDNDLYLLSISQLDQVVRSLNSIDRHFLIQSDETASSQQSTIELMKNLLRRIRVSYGTVSVTKQKYDEAVTAFLSADPPAYPEAIRAARLASDWRLVLTLTGRQATAEGVNPFQRLQKVAAELVSAFRESQEQGDGEHEAACSVLPSYLNSKVESNTTDKSSNSDRALEAAQLSLEYHDDVETATGILLSARKWNDALYTVMKKNRTDLLMDEVAPAIRDACWELLKVLPKLAKRQAELVAELTLLWKDPTDRLTKVKESDPQSFLVSTGWREGDDDGGAVDGQDTRSEFSAASNVSYVSFASNASSHQSGTSTVSVLSNVSLSRGVPSSAASNSAFSISGIEHSLLSRGKSERPNTAQLTKGGQVRKVSDKRQQRWDRKKSHRQFGSDPMNLKTELTICEELWSLAHFDVLATETVHLCEALVLLSGKSTYSKSKLPEAVAMKLTENSVLFSTDSNISLTSDSSSVYLSDSMLAALLQSAVDDHAAHVRSHTPPVGPPYPVHFLVRKNMTVLQRFQDEMSDTDVPGGLFQANKNTAGSSNISKLTIPIKSYWQVAADGILLWQSMRKLSLN